jgi:hypothetical protein
VTPIQAKPQHSLCPAIHDADILRMVVLLQYDPTRPADVTGSGACTAVVSRVPFCATVSAGTASGLAWPCATARLPENLPTPTNSIVLFAVLCLFVFGLMAFAKLMQRRERKRHDRFARPCRRESGTAQCRRRRPDAQPARRIAMPFAGGFVGWRSVARFEL